MMKKLISFAKIVLLITIMLTCVLASPCVAQELGGISRTIKTPQDIVRWFSTEFEYQMKIPDQPQTPEETLAMRTGDCDDFAYLAAAILTRNGIKSEVVIIKYRGLNIMHAICVYKDKDGAYGFISNNELRCTGELDITRAVAKFYPSWEKIMVVNEKRDYMETIATAS